MGNLLAPYLVDDVHAARPALGHAVGLSFLRIAGPLNKPEFAKNHVWPDLVVHGEEAVIAENEERRLCSHGRRLDGLDQISYPIV